MNNINLTQRQLDLIKKNQAILSKLPIETYTKVVNTMNDLRINQSKLSDWASYMNRVTKHHPMFKSNLFSEKILDDFISSNSFPEDEVRKVSTHLRKSFVDAVDVPILGKTVNSAHPIDDVNTKESDKIFYKSINQYVLTPSSSFVHDVSLTVAKSVAVNMFVRTANDDYVNYFFSTAVIAVCYVASCLANAFDLKNKRKDFK
ncbi:TPA: hypothetical protein PIK15_002551 [Staphylococcus aureus]|nr:hypothetical protein [Staphylococcus aureus]HDE9327342.1 hypothetical protein [Staphylococcus aureus]HDH5607368.1 hypothetical protein [Staphylococcus aureus]HDH5664873.1 hypothetical protein [Staphylococcus aureus]HDH5683700.1 hypothetical protein [Staphylococcus aureus]